LWIPLLKDPALEVRAAAAQGALGMATAASLQQLQSSGEDGKQVLRLLVDMLASGDPTVSRVVAGNAGAFVSDGGKILMALYAGEGGKDPGGRGGIGDSAAWGERMSQGTQGVVGVAAAGALAREQAVSNFIEEVGARLREHGNKERHERAVSLNEFSALLRSLGSIGCEIDPNDGLGLTVLVWVLFQLIDVWGDRDTSFNFHSYDEIVRVCSRGRIPLARLL
ncbi:unnamed protein product, partial [Choristocarpus tenellus]